MPLGWFIWQVAAVATPPSPANPAVPLPQMVVMVPPASTFLILLLVPSAITTFPAASAQTPTTPGPLPPDAPNRAAVAGPPSPVEPPVPVPATVVMMPVARFTFLTRLSPLSAMYRLVRDRSRLTIYWLFSVPAVAGPL